MSKRAETGLERRVRQAVNLFKVYLLDRYGDGFWSKVPETRQGQQDLVDLWGIRLLAQGYVLRSVMSYTRYVLRWLGISRPSGKPKGCVAA